MRLKVLYDNQFQAVVGSNIAGTINDVLVHVRTFFMSKPSLGTSITLDVLPFQFVNEALTAAPENLE